MSKDLANPLQALVKKAALTLPANTGSTALQQARIDKRAGEVVILADVSGSMESPAAGGRRKIDVLRDAVGAARGGARLVAFSRAAREVQQIPEPESSTDLAAGLEFARRFDPGVTLVISDGEPDSESDALAVARQFRGAIDVLYIGLESNTHAIDFMRRLAAASGGTVTINDVATPAGVRMLQQRIAGLLPGPAR